MGFRALPKATCNNKQQANPPQPLNLFKGKAIPRASPLPIQSLKKSHLSHVSHTSHLQLQSAKPFVGKLALPCANPLPSTNLFSCNRNRFRPFYFCARRTVYPRRFKASTFPKNFPQASLIISGDFATIQHTPSGASDAAAISAKRSAMRPSP